MTKIVLGGGLGGLSAAYYLTKKFPNTPITLIESSNRTGGWIKSNRLPTGPIFEEGPRTIRPRGAAGANTLQLIQELGLSDEITAITSDSPAAKNRLIYAEGSLHLLPSKLSGLFVKQTPFTKPLILHLLNDLRAQRKPVLDEPVYDFISRRFSNEMADYLISPLICGICAGNAKEISVKFLMKQLFEYEQQYGSVSRGLVQNIFKKSKTSTDISTSELSKRAKIENWSVYSFINGCETLPLALNKYIVENNVNALLNSQCKEIEIDAGKVVLHLNNNTVTADHLVSAVPATNLGVLVEKQHPNLAQLLKKLVKNVSVAVVNLHFDKNVIKDPAFGLLVAPKEQLPVLGVIYDSCCFPKENCGSVLTVMMGGHWFEQHFGENPSEKMLLDIALNQLKQILKIFEQPVEYKVNILHRCMPQYIVGHEENLQKIYKYIENNKLPVTLCGASYHGVGLNDVILSAKNAVNKVS